MIPVKRVRKPRGFDAEVKKPGNAWLIAHPGAKRPKPYWTPFLAHLEAGFAGLCGYAAMLDPIGGSVDHYLSFKNRRDLAYEWSNYRYASSTLNASKQNADAAVLDPYEVQPGWFEILLPSLQMRTSPAIPLQWKAKAELTLKKLKLRNGERIVRWRRRWYQMYLQEKLSLAGLAAVAPLLAAAVEQQLASASRPENKRRKAGKH